MSKRMTIAVACMLAGAAVAAPLPSFAQNDASFAQGNPLVHVEGIAVGDFNGDGRIDVADVDAQFRAGERAYGEADYMAALQLFLPLAEPCRAAFKVAENESPRPETCKPMAATYLSYMHDRGLGVERNSALAGEWSEVAATFTITPLPVNDAPAIPEGAGGGGSALGP